MRVITVGRDASNDRVIDDPYATRNHLQIIQHDDGHFSLADFGSTNGTYVNGQKINGEIPLNDMDIVRIGNTTIPWRMYFDEEATTQEKQQPMSHIQPSTNGSHIFNEQEKRMEPIDNTCMCCGKDHSTGEKDNFYITLYKEKDRTDLVVYRNVKYNYIDIGVARCPKCKEIQKKVKRNTVLCNIAVGLGFAALLFSFGIILINSMSWIIVGGIIIVAGLVAAIRISLSDSFDFEEKLCKKTGILSKKEAAQQYKIVQELLENKWGFEPPSA